jgi:type I restriction enzyme S subunit
MELKPGYKQTEVGVIPEDWDVKTLGNIGTVIRGASPRPKSDKRYYGGSVPRLMVEDVTRDKVWVTPSIDFLTEEGAKRSRSCKRGTLTIVCSGTPTVVGLPSLLAVDACIHDGMLALTHVDKEVSTHFLFHQLRSIQNRLHAAATHGGTFVNLTTTGLRAFKVMLPPTKVEQEAIAETLSDLDVLINALGQLIAKKRDTKQATIQQLLTGKQRLPGFESKSGFKQTEAGVIPKDWEVAKLSAVCSMKSGLGITSTNIDRFSEYPCYGGNGLRGYTKDFTHDGSYALIGRQGAQCGNVLGVKGKFFASEHAIVVSSLAQTDILWLTIVLGGMRLNHYAESSAQPGLSVSKLLSLYLALPSTKIEQTAIATILTDMDAELAALERKRDKIRALKEGMIQELLTGKTRLV